MYGEIARIGLITLASDASALPEFQRLMPDGVQVYPAPILLPRGEVTAAALSEMLETDQLEQAASLLTWNGVQVILFACTTGSLVHGPGWDEKLGERISRASGIPATTTTTAVLSALTAIGATRLAVATPYIDELNDIERDFLVRSGFEIISIAGLGCATDPEIGRLRPTDAQELARRVDRPEADAIFISCTSWHVVERVPQMESEHAKPVVTSNLAGAWAVLRAVNVAGPEGTHGALFDNYLPAY